MKFKLRKRLSAPGLLKAVKVRFSRIIDPIKNNTDFPIVNCLMSGLAMFSLKYRSLLQFDQSLEDEKIRHNLGSLYGVDKVPSDTYLRTRLDDIDPENLQPAFKACFSAVQRGKQLPLYEFLDGYYLVSNDGTGMFHSEKVHCANCCVKHHRNGKVSYYHQSMCAVMVHPDQSTVLPLTMEPILKQDGNTKNDCERNASKRLLEKMRKMHPKLRITTKLDTHYCHVGH